MRTVSAFIEGNGESFFVGQYDQHDDIGYATQNSRQDNDEDFEPDEIERGVYITDVNTPRMFHGEYFHEELTADFLVSNDSLNEEFGEEVE